MEEIIRDRSDVLGGGSIPYMHKIYGFIKFESVVWNSALSFSEYSY